MGRSHDAGSCPAVPISKDDILGMAVAEMPLSSHQGRANPPKKASGVGPEETRMSGV